MKLVKLVIAALVVFSMGSCMKGDDTPPFDFAAQLEKEKPLTRQYAAENYPDAIESEYQPGIWYEILEEGEADSYEYRFNESVNQYIYPNITVRYKGSLLDGTQFDENDTEAGWTTRLDQVITAWQIAFFPQEINEREVGGLTPSGLQKGAKIILITPSYYAYGNQTRPGIPANSPLVFELEVIDIKDN